MVATNPYIITKLIPFNPHRFDACMSYLAQATYRRPLTIFELVKLHVMIDVFHVLQHGHQAIGGELAPWPYGPVVELAYNRLRHWHRSYEESGSQPSEYEVLSGEVTAFQPKVAFDPEDISLSELEAMAKAVELLRPMSFDAAYRFFHSNDTFMGRAYNIALAQRRALAWSDIIDAHDQIHGSNLQPLKRRLISYASG
jgi:hypothetical protein